MNVKDSATRKVGSAMNVSISRATSVRAGKRDEGRISAQHEAEHEAAGGRGARAITIVCMKRVVEQRRVAAPSAKCASDATPPSPTSACRHDQAERIEERAPRGASSGGTIQSARRRRGVARRRGSGERESATGCVSGIERRVGGAEMQVERCAAAAGGSRIGAQTIRSTCAVRRRARCCAGRPATARRARRPVRRLHRRDRRHERRSCGRTHSRQSPPSGRPWCRARPSAVVAEADARHARPADVRSDRHRQQIGAAQELRGEAVRRRAGRAIARAPKAISLPSRMMAMRSASVSASVWSWVT